MKTERYSILIGIISAILITVICYRYYQFKSENDALRSSNTFFESIEALDYKYNDLKYKYREEKHADSKVALIALDESSVREIERWPWSRELMATMTQRLVDFGVKAIGFDVIFSESEKGNAQADPLMGQTVQKNADKIVLGVMSDNLIDYHPYQDYCVTEAFLATKGDQIVKLNPSFVVDDTGDDFEDLEWGDFFKQLFASLNSNTEAEVLLSLGKTKVEELNPYQKNFLEARQSEALFQFCQNWLTDKDQFLQSSAVDQVNEIYKKLFAKSKVLSALTIEQAKNELRHSGHAHPVPQRGQWTANVPVIQEPATYTASFVAKQDQDGYVRRYPMFFRSGNRIGTSFIPSLALQTYLVGTGYRADVKVTEADGKKKISSFAIMDPSKEPEQKVMELPVDGMGQVLVNYYGKQMSVDYVPAKELFSEFEDMVVMKGIPNGKTAQIRITGTKVKKAEYFKDRIVLVGATATALYDLRTTPLEANYPGPEIHMTMLANLLEQNFIRTWLPENRIMPLIVLLVGISLSLLWAHMGAMFSMFSLFVLYFTVVAIEYYLFVKHNTLVSGLFLIIQLSVIYFTITVFKYFTEERKKAELKKTFSKYVSPAVVDEILKEPENLKLGGRKEVMTVFFSDVRGFTTISEKLSPTDLSKLLNRYLTPMTEIVFENKGTLDKYMGDAIMAFFGAPIRDVNHAAQACRCALRSLEKLKLIQDELRKENLPVIDIGIGINTGEMSVGNMGSNIVQNYTVMGDSVNLGSRLEGINKEYGTRIIISEFTQKELPPSFITREIDRVKVKGKNEPVRIFELISEEAPSEQKRTSLAHFSKGYELYLQKSFNQAIDELKKAFELDPKDSVSELYIERCTEYLAEPPPADWDGVFVMKTK